MAAPDPTQLTEGELLALLAWSRTTALALQELLGVRAVF